VTPWTRRQDICKAAGYLGSLTVDLLKDVWIAASRLGSSRASDEDAMKMDDAGAELGLRNEEPPFEAVQSEAIAMVEEIKRDGLDNPGIEEKVRQFP